VGGCLACHGLYDAHRVPADAPCEFGRADDCRLRRGGGENVVTTGQVIRMRRASDPPRVEQAVALAIVTVKAELEIA